MVTVATCCTLAAVAALLARLAKPGVPTARLRRIAPSALKPAPIDVLTAPRT